MTRAATSSLSGVSGDGGPDGTKPETSQKAEEASRSQSRSSIAAALAPLARLPRTRSRLIRLLCRLEGGQMWSPTYRHLMKEYYGVDIGRYSYGPCLWPGHLPRGTRVGSYCSLASGITVFRRNHPASRISQHPFFFNATTGLLAADTIEAVHERPLDIGADVWIGANAIITPRCDSIGAGAIIGAGAVVTKNVPAFTIVAGNPARPLRTRFSPEICDILLETRWWEHPIERLTPLLSLFLADATVESARQLNAALAAN